jgi:hypothetical protein
MKLEARLLTFLQFDMMQPYLLTQLQAAFAAIRRRNQLLLIAR